MHRVIAIYVLVASVTLIVYLQAGSFQFINYDDPGYVYENARVTSGLSLENLRWAMTATQASNWHPLTWISHMLDFELYGLNPKGHHLTNVFLHLINTLLLCFVLHRITGALYRSAFVAALFALHPLHVESVAWISERKDLLSALFFILSLLAYGRYAARPSALRYLLILFPFMLGVMAKSMIVTLPFLLLLLDYWPLNRLRFKEGGNGIPIGRLLLEKAPFLVLSLVASMLTYQAQQKAGAVLLLENYPLPSRLANAALGYGHYLLKVFRPDPLPFFYPLSFTPSGPEAAGTAVLLICITLLVFRKAGAYPFLPVGWLWFVMMLLPVIGLVQVGMQSMANRYTYLPLTGLFLILAWGVPEILKQRPHSRLIMTTAAAVSLVSLAAVTYVQLGHWRDSVALFTYTLSVTENNFTIHNNLGIALAEQGKNEEAVKQYREAIRIQPDFAEAHFNLGIDLDELGRREEAVTHYQEAIRINPGDTAARSRLADDLEKTGRREEAAFHRSRLLQPR